MARLPTLPALPEKLREKLKVWAPRIGYPIFFIFSFAFFASVVFPYDKLKERIVVTFNSQQKSTGAQQELQIDDLTSSFVTGVKAKGVRLVSLPTEAGKPPAVVSIDEARARISVLPLLIGHRNVSFHIDAFAGEIDGTFEEHGKDRAVEVELKAVDLSKIEPVTVALGVPVDGKLSGTVNLSMPEGKASKGSGTVNLEASDVAVGDGKAKLKGALALPRLTVGTVSFVAEAKEGVLRVSKFGGAGKDADVSGEGRIQMRELATESVCDMNVKFKVNDSYRNKSEITKSLFGAPGTSQSGLFEMVDPKVKKAKRSDGSYAFHLRGLLGRPDFEPLPGGTSPF